ncbi:hypothetical protein TRVL_06312 [Trypanosoma vivax]|nr:hypothetical protein TRVL_06312 [Trypanosoma vivax]
MPATDTDTVAVPDMIEAQLTLSYSRLTVLLRLIIDQGNAHEMDIDKMHHRLEALERENAVLRESVNSLTEERTRNSGIREMVEELNQKMSVLAVGFKENCAALEAIAKQNSACAEMLESKLKSESEIRRDELHQMNASFERLQEFSDAIEKNVCALNDFVALWGIQREEVRSLISGAKDCDQKKAADAYKAYLLSLPTFLSLSEELEVLRCMQKQQGSGTLAGRGALAALRRASRMESADATDDLSSNALKGTALSDRDFCDNAQARLSEQDKRLRSVEHDGTISSGRSPVMVPQFEVFTPKKRDDHHSLKEINERLHSLEVTVKSLVGPQSSVEQVKSVEGDGVTNVGGVRFPSQCMASSNDGEARPGTGGALLLGSYNGRNTNTEPPNVSPWQTPQEAEIWRRIERLEEASSALDARKADHRELGQLGEALQHAIREQLLLPTFSVPMHLTTLNSFTRSDAMIGVGVGTTATGRVSRIPESPKRSSRPIYVSGSAHFLRDMSGVRTAATFSSSQQ